MKFARRIYHFLGGIYFALILIAAVALFVICGTFIESITQSHLYAALFTYDNPLFSTLLWGFFINILFSATRRWPFRWKHVPFLTTHLGLLMILTGVLAKHYFGVQGTMSLSEGTASDEILLSNTYAIHVDSKSSEKPVRYPLQKSLGGNFHGLIAQNDDSLSIRLAEFYPHCTEHLASWVKGSHAFIGGLKPIPMYQVTGEEKSLPVGGQTKLHHPESYVWDLYALKTSNLEKTIGKLYSQNAHIAITDRLTKKTVHELPLENLGSTPLIGELSLPFIPLKGFDSPQLKIHYGDQAKLVIPLMGDQALFNLYEGPFLGYLPIAIDIIQKPLLAIIQDDAEDVYLVSFDPHGKVWAQPFPKGNLDVLVSYDDGFAGYTARAALPFKAYPAGRREIEEALAYPFTLQLRQAIAEGTALSSPLQMMLNASKKTNMDFPEEATLFFSHWNDSNDWLYQENRPLPNSLKTLFAAIDWTHVPPSIKQACEWTVQVFKQLSPDLKHNPCLITALRKNSWPLIESLEFEIASSKDEDKAAPYTLLTHQLFAAAELRPRGSIVENDSTPEQQAALLSAYLRAYGIHFASILPFPNETDLDQMIHSYLTAKSVENLQASPISLETLVSPKQQVAVPTKKLETNKPKVTLFVSKGSRKQALSLGYDQTGKGLKWPILDGEYLMRFQPQFQDIPYRLRLRQARQINYANSTQPYSFEGELLFTDQRNQKLTEKTISMNQVHETWDGYRFYLSSITPSDESAVKQVQIVVNYDPAKYLLTYPGAIVLSCGILMLFLLRPYRRL